MIDRLEQLSPEERRRLALRLRQTRRPEAAPPRQEIPRQGGPGPHPASFPQRRLWFLDRLTPGSAAYHIPMVVRLRGPLDPAALAGALREVVRRHESLRTVFAEDSEGEPVQEVVPPEASGAALPLVDLTGVPETAMTALVAEIAGRPFDLARGPLLRAALLRLSGSDHVVVIVLHHIVSDGWSVALLTRELMALYGAAAAGRPSPLPQLPIQYGDFARWQRQRLSGDLLRDEMAWWRQRLAGLPPRLDLPADHPRPPVATGRGAHRAQILTPALAGSLQAFARRREATPFMLFLAAFQVLLARLAGAEDLAVGVPVSGRDRREVRELIGFFVGSLVMRGDLRGEPTFAAFLDRTRETALGAQEHAELPLEVLVEELQPERDPGRTPLFQVMFAFQNTPREELDVSGLAVAPVPLDWRSVPFDLSLAVEEREGTLLAGWDYATDLFDTPTVLRMTGHFQRLLEEIAADPERPVWELPLLSEAESSQLRVEWNATTVDYPRDATLPELFALQVRQTPDAVAVTRGNEWLSYGELDRRAGRLASRLRGLGVAPEVPVAVLLERSPELVLAMVAVLRAGGAYVPLDAGSPPQRLARVLEDSGTRILLTREGLAGGLPVARLAVVRVDTAPPDAGTEDPPDPGSSPENAVCLFYTSGSTGQPKGVVVPHRSIVSLIRGSDFMPFAPGERVAHVSNPAFDAATLEIWGALLTGASVVVFESDEVVAPAKFAARLRDEGITILHITAAVFRQVAREAPAAFAPLGYVIFGGEAVDPWAVRTVREQDSPTRLLQGYGPTETTTLVSWYAVGRSPRAAEDANVPIGRPIPGTRLHIADRSLGPQPIGVPGELCVGGEAPARGYHGRPELTAERFVPDPWSGEPGARVYRTGDLARIQADAEIEFLGRLDHQVKIRGFRVEPAEVEAALADHPGVGEAVVLPREDAPGERRLVAYVVPGPGDGLDLEELRRFLEERLPRPMVPAAFVTLESLPLTPVGKIDRHALPAPAAPAGRDYTAPRGPVEEGLAAIWREVLKVDRVGVHDNFFDLGGHSLVANRVALRVRSLFQVELPLQSLFEEPTIARLARRIEEGAPSRAPLPALAAGHGTPVPLSFAQQRLWFLDQLEPGRVDYHVPLAVRLAGGLDVPALERTLEEIVRRHASLRTRFVTEAGEPRQVVSPPHGLALPQIDLSALNTDAEREARRLAAETAGRPFDLRRGPIFRLLLLRLAPEDHALVAVLHHIVGDGWSMGIFVREITALYDAFRQGLPSPLPELPLQYPDFAVAQRAWLDGPELAGALDWWRRRLAGLPPVLELPFDRPRGAARGRAQSEPVRLPADLVQPLATLGHRDGATLFMVLLAAFQALLGRSARQADVAVGTPVANRGRLEIEGLIGFFVNTLVLRAEMAGDPGFRGFLAQVRKTALGAYAHQEVPFEKLVEELEPERALGRTPLFQVMFRLEEGAAEPLDLPGLALRPLAVDHGAVRVDLTLTLFEEDGGLAGSLDYDGSLFDPATVRRMAGHLRGLLEGIAADPERRLSLLPWLTEAERHELTLEWNDTAAPFEHGRCLHELFEEQAARTPDAVAVVFEDEALTFAGLDARADRLGNRLRALGAGPEVPVGLCVERSAEMVVGLLAVLKAGGAYLPLDPAFPEERLRFQMRDAGAGVLVLQDRLRRALPGLAGDARAVVSVESDEERGGRCAGGALPANLAYVIYTSGSTGRPKGVPVEHRQLLGYLRGVIERLDLPAGASFATVSTLAADLGHTTLFPPLIAGGCLHVLSRDRAGDAEAMAEYFATRAVDCLKIVPSHLAALQGVAPRLRLILGGEASDAEEVRRLAAAAPGCRVFNHYGPTETTVGVATHPAGTESARARRGTLPLGRPLPGVVIRLLDPWLGPVPAGVTGELCVGGPSVARGYPGHPDLTAERFVPDPAGRGSRLYRTGDLARLLPGGEIEFLGRADTQVKIRGFRVEPGEVEAALRSLPGVRDAAVLARDGRLVAYAVPSGEPLTLAAVRAGLGRSLPDPMLPAALVVLDALPLTPNGKLDRAALGRIAPETRTGEYAPPRDAVEEKLAALWSELLGVERPGIHDGFFDLGGHSLLITRLRSRVQAAFGVDVPLRDLFARPTLAETAAAVRVRQGSGAPAGMRLTAIPRARHSMRRADLDKTE